MSKGGRPELAKVLALLAAQNNYSYIDKIAQATSKDLVLYHIREALRDYHTLLKGEEININIDRLADEIDELMKVENIAQLREKTSFIAAEALAIALGKKKEASVSPEGDERG